MRDLGAEVRPAVDVVERALLRIRLGELLMQARSATTSSRKWASFLASINITSAEAERCLRIARHAPPLSSLPDRPTREPAPSPAAPALPAPPPCPVVYFLRAGTDGPIKIGTTTDVAGRIRSLQCASASDLILLGARPGSASDEAALHRQFAAHRIRGEWFRAHPSLLKHITDSCSPEAH